MRKGNVTFWLLAVAIVATGVVAYWKFVLWQTPAPAPAAPASRTAEMVDYTSKDLKISLKYPRRWYIDDRYPLVLLTDFPTSQNRNDKPSSDQIQIVIRNFSNCFPGFERDLIEPACGQGGEAAKRKIISKEMKEVGGGTYYKYIVEAKMGQRTTYYLLVSGDRVLQISKQPDPSRFEKEFEEIVGSIKFL